jgi:hypothetical protein
MGLHMPHPLSPPPWAALLVLLFMPWPKPSNALEQHPISSANGTVRCPEALLPVEEADAAITDAVNQAFQGCPEQGALPCRNEVFNETKVRQGCEGQLKVQSRPADMSCKDNVWAQSQPPAGALLHAT